MNPSAANFKKFGAISIGAIALALPLRAAQSVSHYGITWTFSADRPTGKFANGEPWVVGPVTITAIDKPSVPLGSTPVGGAMINPIPNRPQGYCPKYTNIGDRSVYDASLDVSLKYPFDLVAGDSLITARALNTGESGGNDHVDTVSALTVLPAAPPEGSFRPGPYGPDRTIRFNKSAIDWTVLKNLAPIEATPTQAWIEARLPALPWFEWDSQWVGATLAPLTNIASGDGGTFRSSYGREVGFKWGYVALWLNLNHTQSEKEKALVQTIQCGIDIASYLQYGGGFPPDGGHKVGRKFPVFMAAVALNDPALLALASQQNVFAEDQTTFFVEQNDVSRVVDSGAAASYVQGDVGIPEWGVRHSYQPAKDDRRWRDGCPYRFANWPAMSGAVLAAELMGKREAWGHPVIFAYNERFVSKEGLGNGFEGQMWDRYKLGRPTAPQGLKKKR